MDDFFQQPSTRPGLRLHKLELFNWGTFDSSHGRVFTVRPDGRTTLLVGQNGAGKSTLADALLTLLVRSSTRNYNVAAGAGKVGQKRNRTERTYVRGAYDHGGDGGSTALRFLRQGAGLYTAILASFCNEDMEGADFTLAQILYLTGDEKVMKVYAFASGEKSIAEDLGGFTSFERLRQQVEQRGFQATTTFSQYERWFFKAAGLRPKAMDVFNQTVAVKDIESLNVFIRQHMLEKRSWKEKIERVLAHFTQLSEAHRVLVQAREQLKLLEPIVRAAKAYEAVSGELKRLRAVKAAVHPWFSLRKVALLEPLIAENEGHLETENARKGELERQIAGREETIRQLHNEIDRAGGPRLQQLPGLIEAAEARAAEKRGRAFEFARSVRRAGVDLSAGEAAPRDETEFDKIRLQLKARAEFLDERIPAQEKKKTGLSFQRFQLDEEIKELQVEIAALRQRKTALPERFVALRRQVCEALHLPERDLPFAAELVAVKLSESAWESSIEMVLRSFALSLLVPDRYYHQVSAFIDRTRLVDRGGKGQRLVYFRIGEETLGRSARDEGEDKGVPVAMPTMLPGKLEFRPNHRLVPWVRGVIERRFSYVCCDTIEQFQRQSGEAMTAQRHVKSGRGQRHEKDDREGASDRRHFVLGWDNREKLKHLVSVFEEKRGRVGQLDAEITRLDSALKKLREEQSAAARALEVTAFHTVDYLAEEKQVAELRQEEAQLRAGTDELRELDRRLKETEKAKLAAQSDRDRCIGSIRDLERDLRTARRVLDEARDELEDIDTDEAEQHFEDVVALTDGLDLGDPLAFDAPERQLLGNIDADIDLVRNKVDPLETRLLDGMARFLRKFEAHGSDLHVGVDYAASFIELHDRIVREDLPGFEQRFKERLNDKAAKEIGILNAALKDEAREIKQNIGLLNDALRSLPYRAGTHMQLLPQDVSDPEIHRFRGQLGDCLANVMQDSSAADEARFSRIEKLITDLRDDDRYRDRVTDVRRWFDFFASEILTETGEERSRYSDSSGRSGGEKAKLAFTILVAAIAYQYQIDPRDSMSERFHFVVVDEMFSKVDDDHARYALELFGKLGLQLFIVAPLDAKARITEDYVDFYLLVTKDESTAHSEIYSMSAERFRQLSEETSPA